MAALSDRESRALTMRAANQRPGVRGHGEGAVEVRCMGRGGSMRKEAIT